LIPLLGDKRLDAIQTEDVQQLKSALGERAAKTVNNVLTVLSVMLRTAVEWNVIERVPCVIKLLRTTKNTASFHDLDEYERLVGTVGREQQAKLVVLLGGEADCFGPRASSALPSRLRRALPSCLATIA